MRQKFQPGDYARIGGSSNRPLPACYPWLCRGRIVKVKAVAGRMPSGHLIYKLNGRRGRPHALLASYELRRPEERDRAAGAGRKPPKQ